ncbi:MAG: DUF2336 domain-containing protein [Rhizobiales bacterium]|nr:DUF2336 domain-containing protein [Hyphomicrobiales bacterium]
MTEAKTNAPRPEKSLERRQTAAEAVARLLAHGLILDGDREAAHAIIERLSHDAEVRVRKILSETISEYALLPRDAAKRLAKDVEEVSLPVLCHSPVLDDEFLIALVQDGDTSENKHVAIAQRAYVSPDLSHALVETRNETVVGTLLDNDGAEIAEHSLRQAADDHHARPHILSLIARRPEATARIARHCHSLLVDDELESEAARQIREVMERQHHIPAPIAQELTRTALERAVTERLGAARSEADIRTYVERLFAQKRLSASLLLRATAAGHLSFLENAMAHLAAITKDEVHAALCDDATTGFRAIYAKARLPEHMRRALTLAGHAVAKRAEKGLSLDPADFLSDLLAAIVTSHREIAPGSLDQIIAQLERSDRPSRRFRR